MLRFNAPLMGAAIVAVAGFFGSPAAAEDIVVTTYPITPNGFVYSVAMAKGFFKEAGADVTGILGSGGGGTTIRTVLNGDLAYGEVALSAAIPAIQRGADIKIIATTLNTASEYVWAARLDSPINSMKDLKGKKIAYTNPGSTTQALDLLIATANGFTPDDVTLVKCGGSGEMLAALDKGLVDVAPIAEPAWSKLRSKYKQLASANDLPPMTNVVAITTGRAAATKGDFLRAVLKGRRMAIDFMRENPDEASIYIAKDFSVSPEVAKNALLNLLESETKTGLPYFEAGRFHPEAINNTIRAMKLVGAVEGDPDWTKMIDEQFLPDDLKGYALGK